MGKAHAPSASAVHCRPNLRMVEVAAGYFSLRYAGAGEGIRTLDPDLGKVVLYP